MIGRKGTDGEKVIHMHIGGYPVRVKVRKIYDKYGIFFILIYGVAKRLYTVMHSLCVFWDGQAEKSLDLSRKEKKQIVFIHMM